MRWVIGVGALGALVVAACVSDQIVGDAGPMDAAKDKGTEGAPCLPGDQCVMGLVCLSSTCVRPPDGSMNLDAGADAPPGVDCGAPQSNKVIQCGANMCDTTAGQWCCMANPNCISSSDSGVCGLVWQCNNRSQCNGNVCCLRNGGTQAGCPYTVGAQTTTKCEPSSGCEPSQARMLCASDADCADSIESKTCRVAKDPKGNLIGICSK